MKIRSEHRVVICCMIVCCGVSRPAMGGDDCPVELGLMGQWNEASSAYADVWGDGDIAYVGQFGPINAGVHFFDVSDPTNPVRFLEWQVPAPNQFASPQDIKVGDGLLFIALDADPNDGVEIVDVRLNRIELPRAAEPAAYSQMREQRRALTRKLRGGRSLFASSICCH